MKLIMMAIAGLALFVAIVGTTLNTPNKALADTASPSPSPSASAMPYSSSSPMPNPS